MKATISFNVDTYTKIPGSSVSKLFGCKERMVENCIDFDISILLLDENSCIIGEEAFIYFNNPVFMQDVIVLCSSFKAYDSSEFDEEILIDFTRMPISVFHILFILSNHQELNFNIVNINVQVTNSSFVKTDSNPFVISNQNVGNAIELFTFSRKSKNEMWNTDISNISIIDNRGMASILNKYFSGFC